MNSGGDKNLWESFAWGGARVKLATFNFLTHKYISQ